VFLLIVRFRPGLFVWAAIVIMSWHWTIELHRTANGKFLCILVLKTQIDNVLKDLHILLSDNAWPFTGIPLSGVEQFLGWLIAYSASRIGEARWATIVNSVRGDVRDLMTDAHSVGTPPGFNFLDSAVK
jgi:hypothetical protein